MIFALRAQRIFLLSALIIVCLSLPAQAQPRTRARTPKTPAAQSNEKERARHAGAVALLYETAEQAREIDDPLYRARLLALAADELWGVDEQRARNTFRRAWAAAIAADKEEQEEIARENSATATSNTVSTSNSNLTSNSNSTAIIITTARREVLIKIAARDPRLADVFLREMAAEKADNQDQNEGQTTRRSPWHELSAAGQQRLAIAYALFYQGDYAQSAQVAAALVQEGVSAELVTLILHLSERQQTEEANGLYLRLLERARADGGADANTVLLLSAQYVSPRLLVVVDESGSLQFRPVSSSLSGEDGFIISVLSGRPAQSTRAARNGFYNVAANILLRPVVLSPDASSSPQSLALYFALGRLIPFFEREAAQYVPELRARQMALAGEIETNNRDRLASQTERLSLAPKGPSDPLRSLNDRLAQAKSAAERDQLTLALVKTAARSRVWDRARRAAATIEDLSTRRKAQSIIAVSQIADISRAYAEDKENDYENLARFVRGADVPPFATAWGLAETALIAARKGERASAEQLISEAEHYALRTNAGTRERIIAYSVLTTAAARVSPTRAWQLLPELVRAINAAEDYAGDETALDIFADDATTDMDANPTEDESAAGQFKIETRAFSLDRIFATMASLDFDKALASARALDSDVPQSFAYLAIAHAALEQTKGNDERGSVN